MPLPRSGRSCRKQRFQCSHQYPYKWSAQAEHHPDCHPGMPHGFTVRPASGHTATIDVIAQYPLARCGPTEADCIPKGRRHSQIGGRCIPPPFRRCGRLVGPEARLFSRSVRRHRITIGRILFYVVVVFIFGQNRISAGQVQEFSAVRGAVYVAAIDIYRLYRPLPSSSGAVQLNLT